MSMLDRIRDRLHSWIENLASRRDEESIAESACCTPEHLLSSEEPVGGSHRRE